MNTCDICSKDFKRRDNMLRHMRNKHGHTQREENLMSESGISEAETTDSETDGGMSDEDEASGTERQSAGDQYDPWDSVVLKAFDKCQDQFEEEVIKLIQKSNLDAFEARRRVYQDMRSTYRKAVSSVLTARIVWFNAIRKDSVYKAIKRTVTNFMGLDDYSTEEAWKSAIRQRKYLFDTILAEYDPPELEGGDQGEDLSEEDEPSAKRLKV